MYLVAVIAHALFGVAALAAGVVAFERPGRAFRPYLIALGLMLGFLVAAVALEWGRLDAGTRMLFGALTALGAVVVACGIEAYRARPARGGSPDARYRRALGFTLVALTDAFLVIAVLDLGAPPWAVVATGVVVAAAGHWALRRRTAVLEGGQPRGAPVPS